jgi:hypothetical protein
VLGTGARRPPHPPDDRMLLSDAALLYLESEGFFVALQSKISKLPSRSQFVQRHISQKPSEEPQFLCAFRIKSLI